MNKDKETTIGEDCANSIAELSGRQALYVLYVLAEKNTTFATAIMEETKKVLFRPIQIESEHQTKYTIPKEFAIL